MTKSIIIILNLPREIHMLHVMMYSTIKFICTQTLFVIGLRCCRVTCQSIWLVRCLQTRNVLRVWMKVFYIGLYKLCAPSTAVVPLVHSTCACGLWRLLICIKLWKSPFKVIGVDCCLATCSWLEWCPSVTKLVSVCDSFDLHIWLIC